MTGVATLHGDDQLRNILSHITEGWAVGAVPQPDTTGGDPLRAQRDDATLLGSPAADIAVQVLEITGTDGLGLIPEDIGEEEKTGKIGAIRFGGATKGKTSENGTHVYRVIL